MIVIVVGVNGAAPQEKTGLERSGRRQQSVSDCRVEALPRVLAALLNTEL